MVTTASGDNYKPEYFLTVFLTLSATTYVTVRLAHYCTESTKMM